MAEPKKEPMTEPTITPRRSGATWKASEPVVEVDAGTHVNFDSEERPARLWFPKPELIAGRDTYDLGAQKVRVQIKHGLAPRTPIPYVFFLLDENDGVGEMLVGNSPPYIKIKDPTGGTRGIDND
jgi:hypothetical protein